jgi:hypothetical protein
MLKFLKHLLVPHSGNNHRAKILHHSSLAVIILTLFFVTFAANLVKKSHPEILGVSYSISENDLIVLVNAQRQSKGLSPLSLRSELSDAARRKAADMFQKNYWAHFSPDGSTSPWEFIRAAGYNYQFAGENLAKGFTDSSSIVSAWMSSETHRANILSDKYREVGFAIVPGTLQGEETVLVVQMFGTTFGQTTAAVPATSAQVQGEVNTIPPTQIPEPTVQVQEAPVVQIQEEPVLTPTPQAELAVVENKPKIDSSITTRAASTMGLTLLAFGFVLDLIIVERKKIPRIIGHNLDHIMLIATFIVFMLLTKGGVIL